MISVVPYFPEHAWALAREHCFPCIGNDPLVYARELWTDGTAFSAMNERHEVVACGGVKPLWAGVGMAWSMLTPAVRAHPFFLHRETLKVLHKVVKTHSLHRVELIVLDEFAAGKKWAKALGFVSEGIRKWYTPDKRNIEMFVRFF